MKLGGHCGEGENARCVHAWTEVVAIRRAPTKIVTFNFVYRPIIFSEFSLGINIGANRLFFLL